MMDCVAVDHANEAARGGARGLFGECAAPTAARLVDVAGGDCFSIAVDENGAVLGWGSAFYGELLTAQDQEDNEEVPAVNAATTEKQATRQHTIASRESDCNSGGASEAPITAHVRTLLLPTQLAVPEKCVRVACGGNHVLIITHQGVWQRQPYSHAQHYCSSRLHWALCVRECVRMGLESPSPSCYASRRRGVPAVARSIPSVCGHRDCRGGRWDALARTRLARTRLELGRQHVRTTGHRMQRPSERMASTCCAFAQRARGRCRMGSQRAAHCHAQAVHVRLGTVPPARTRRDSRRMLAACSQRTARTRRQLRWSSRASRVRQLAHCRCVELPRRLADKRLKVLGLTSHATVNGCTGALQCAPRQATCTRGAGDRMGSSCVPRLF